MAGVEHLYAFRNGSSPRRGRGGLLFDHEANYSSSQGTDPLVGAELNFSGKPGRFKTILAVHEGLATRSRHTCSCRKVQPVMTEVQRVLVRVRRRIVNPRSWDAVYVALAIVLVGVFTALRKWPGGSGHDGYLEIAQSMANCGVYGFNCQPTTGRSPLYPLLLLPAQFGAGLVWVFILNFTCLAFGAILLRRVTASYGFGFPGVLALVIFFNPAVVMLGKNSMPYPLAMLLGVTYLFSLSRGFLWLSALIAILLYFTHPSFIFTALILFALPWFLLVRGRRFAVAALLAATFVVLSSSWIHRNYDVSGEFEMASATGSGFQYQRAKNQYEIGGFDDYAIFRNAGLDLKSGDINFSVVNPEFAGKVDKKGRSFLIEDLTTPTYLIPKTAVGLFNTVSSGLTPEKYFLPPFLLLILLLALVRRKRVRPTRNDQIGQMVVATAFVLQMGILAFVGFRMRYAAYFISILPFSLSLIAIVTSVWHSRGTRRTEPKMKIGYSRSHVAKG